MRWLLVSGTVTYLSPNYESMMQQMLAQMPTTSDLTTSPEYLHYMHSISLMDLFVPMLILAMLLYYRERFLNASSASAASKLANTN